MAKTAQGARRPYRVALTGARTFLGERLIRRLEADPDCEHIVALDIRPPVSGGVKTRFTRLDLTNPAADEQAARILVDDGVDTLCHLAFLSKPSHSGSWAHELEAIGTLYIMNAAAEARVHKVVMQSTTMAYGPHPTNPAFLTEGHALRGVKRSRWVNDKVSAERELAKLARDCPDIVTTALRFGLTVGRGTDNFWTRVLERQFVIRLMGYDPVMQFLHEDDAVDALALAVREDHPGAYNIVAPDTLYLSDVLKLGGRVGLRVPHVFGAPVSDLLFNVEVAPAPGPFLDFLRYTFACDDRKMRREMGFSPRYTSRDALMALYGRRGTPVSAAHALGDDAPDAPPYSAASEGA